MSIVINDVSKNFGKGTCVLKNIDMRIENGVFGIIGYNSSGKSTLVKIITSLIEPTSGSVELFEKKINFKKSKDIKKYIGYLPQSFSFYENCSILDFLDYMAKMHGIDKSIKKERIKQVLEELSLYEDRKLRFYQLSEGMKRRVGLAQAIMNKPKILIVDDPISSVDKDEKRIMKELLNRYGKDNIVIITTRNASDLDGIASNIAVMHKGNICFNGSAENLIKNANGRVWISNVGEFLDVRRLKGIHKVVSFNKVGEEYFARVISDVKPCKDSKIVPATLEDAFLYSVYSS
ncbi:MAG: ABC transporter ATP-binding protein [Acidaminobacteraceae bacterium]